MKCSVEVCQEESGARGLCSWHEYRKVQIKNVTRYVEDYLKIGIGEDDPRVINYRRRIAQYEAEMHLPKAVGSRNGSRKAKPKANQPWSHQPKSALMRTVRDAINLFLQSPSTGTATDAKLAIDRYMKAYRR